MVEDFTGFSRVEGSLFILELSSQIKRSLKKIQTGYQWRHSDIYVSLVICTPAEAVKDNHKFFRKLEYERVLACISCPEIIFIYIRDECYEIKSVK